MSKTVENRKLNNIQLLEDQPSNEILSGKKLFLRATLLSFLFLCIFFILTAVVIGLFTFYKASSFTQKTNTSFTELYQLVKTGINQKPIQDNNHKNILILGIDSVENKPNSPQLTDTMLLASINLKTGKINTLSLPRDLWSNAYQTRINALYEYGKERYPENPKRFPTEVVSELTEIQIHHTITLSLEQLAELVDIVGGINITVPNTFTDTEFPRDDVDINTASQEELYETVTFEKGPQTMDGKTVLKYIRSRKSSDITQGTDNARASRQQEVITALLEKIQSKAVLTSPDTLADLYNYYNTDFSQQLELTELISTVYSLYPQKNSISLTGHSLSIYPDIENGVITNPPLYKYSGQWVYEITDQSSFASEVKAKLQQK